METAWIPFSTINSKIDFPLDWLPLLRMLLLVCGGYIKVHTGEQCEADNFSQPGKCFCGFDNDTLGIQQLEDIPTTTHCVSGGC